MKQINKFVSSKSAGTCIVHFVSLKGRVANHLIILTRRWVSRFFGSRNTLHIKGLTRDFNYLIILDVF